MYYKVWAKLLRASQGSPGSHPAQLCAALANTQTQVLPYCCFSSRGFVKCDIWKDETLWHGLRAIIAGRVIQHTCSKCDFLKMMGTFIKLSPFICKTPADQDLWIISVMRLGIHLCYMVLSCFKFRRWDRVKHERAVWQSAGGRLREWLVFLLTLSHPCWVRFPFPALPGSWLGNLISKIGKEKKFVFVTVGGREIVVGRKGRGERETAKE